MCGVDIPEQQPQKEKELISAPTYADAQTQSAVAAARKQAQKYNNENIRTSARGVMEAPNTQKYGLGVFDPNTKNFKKALGE